MKTKQDRINKLATKIADKLLWINGLNQLGNCLSPGIICSGLLEPEYAGIYNREELIREIESVLNDGN